MITEEIQALKTEVSSLRKAIASFNNDAVISIFPLQTSNEVGRLFGVSRHTVVAWHKQGLLKGHYQILSGRTCRLVFTQRDLVKFFDENFPSPADLASTPFHPKSRRSERIKRMLSMERLYHRRRSRKGE